MPRRLPLSEIIKETSRIKSDQGKIDYMLQHQSEPLKILLKVGMDPNIQWDLPEGTPPYKPLQALDQEGRLYSEARRLYLFLKGGPLAESKVKRERLFVELLESVHPLDAEMLIAAKDKKLPRGVPKKVVNIAFPGLISDEQNEQAS